MGNVQSFVVVCAWCGVQLPAPELPGCLRVSHGICPQCLEQVQRDFELVA